MIRNPKTHYVKRLVAVAFPATGKMVVKTVYTISWTKSVANIMKMREKIVKTFPSFDHRDPEEVTTEILKQIVGKLKLLFVRRRTSVRVCKWILAGQRWLASDARRIFREQKAREQNEANLAES